MALARAIEHQRDAESQILDDPYAEWFLSRPSRLALTSWKWRGPTARLVDRLDPGGVTWVSARHRYLDDCMVAALRAGAEQVLILGAGYDMQAWRFVSELDGRPVFEVDLEAIGDRKARILEEHAAELATVDRRRVVIDFEEQTLAEVLGPAGFAAGVQTMVIWEGVAMYLTRAAVKDTLSSVRSLVGEGSELAMDMWYVVDDPGVAGSAVRTAANALSLIGEPVTFPLHPEEAPHFVGRFGWRVNDIADHDDMQRRYSPDRPIAPSGYNLTAITSEPAEAA